MTDQGTIEQQVEIARLYAEIDKAATERSVLRGKYERLRSALTRYGRHLVGCSFYRDGPHQASPDTVCDCGLVASLSSTQDAEL